MMPRQDWEYVFGFLERLNHYLLFKWTRKGLPMPAIVILLTHRMDQLHYVMDELKTKSERIAFLNAWWKGKVCMSLCMLVCSLVLCICIRSAKFQYDLAVNTYMRGCPACPHMIDYARTFRVPVWSWPDATYPSISRWFINTYDGNVSTYGRWRYSHDLTHFSDEGGDFFVQNIAGPFLKEQVLAPQRASADEDEVQRSPASKWNDVFEFDLHVTSRAPLRLLLAAYTSWGVHENTLVNITYSPLH